MQHGHCEGGWLAPAAAAVAVAVLHVAAAALAVLWLPAAAVLPCRPACCPLLPAWPTPAVSDEHVPESPGGKPGWAAHGCQDMSLEVWAEGTRGEGGARLVAEEGLGVTAG